MHSWWKRNPGYSSEKVICKTFLFLGFWEWCVVVPSFYVFSVAEINLYSDNFTKTLHKFLMNIQGNNQRNSLFNFWRWSHKDKVDDVGKISSVTNTFGGFGFCRFSLPRKPDSTRHSQDEDGHGNDYYIIINAKNCMLVMCDVSKGEILIINTGSQCNGQRNVWWQKCAAVFWEAFRFWQKLCKNKIMMCNLSFFGDSLNNTTQRRSRKERKLGEKINFVKLYGQFVRLITGWFF